MKLRLESNEKGNNSVKGGVKAIGTATGMGIGLAPAMMALGNLAKDKGPTALTDPSTMKKFKKLADNMGVGVTTNLSRASIGNPALVDYPKGTLGKILGTLMGPAYALTPDRKAPVIMGVQGAGATAAHELGHAKIHNYLVNKFGKTKGTKVFHGITAGPLGTLKTLSALGAYYTVGSSDLDDEQAKRRAYGLAGISTLAAMPRLGHEIGASVLGYKGLKAAGASKAELARAVGKFGAAGLTYGIGAVGPLGIVAGLRYLRKRKEDSSFSKKSNELKLNYNKPVMGKIMLRKQSAEIINEVVMNATPEELDYILRKSSAIAGIGGKIMSGLARNIGGFKTMGRGVKSAWNTGKVAMKPWLNSPNAFNALGRSGMTSVAKSAVRGAMPTIAEGARQAAPMMIAGGAGLATMGAYGLGRSQGRAAQQNDFRNQSRMQRLRQAW